MKSRWSAQIQVAAFQQDVPPTVEITEITPSMIVGDQSHAVLSIQLDYLDLNLHLRSPQACIALADAILGAAHELARKQIDLEMADRL
jgi:hypothetical protein